MKRFQKSDIFFFSGYICLAIGLICYTFVRLPQVKSKIAPLPIEQVFELHYSDLQLDYPLLKHSNKDFRKLKDEYMTYLIKYAKNNRVSPILATALLYQESEGKTWAQSDMGALGLMQIMPRDHYRNGHPLDLTQNPLLNIKLGINYLKQCLKATGSEWEAVQAYNTGIGNWQSGVRSRKHAKSVFRLKKEITLQMEAIQTNGSL